MSIFWFSLFYLITVWGLATYTKIGTVEFDSITLLLSTVFFSLYFCLSLVKERQHIFHFILTGLLIIVFFTFSSATFNGYIFLIVLILAVHVINHLNGWQLYLQLFIQYTLVISPYVIAGDHQLFSYFTLLMLLIGFLFFYWRRTNRAQILLSDEYDQLQHNYRKLKRQVVINEKNVRQEERNQIARELHDSVGHRLTALLMQLEVARMQTSDSPVQEKFDQLKSLAQVSLDETREAVNALKSEETTGLTAVIQLIRKLESESHLRVSFQIQSGTLSFPLSNQQSVTIYRSVQEALTNMMRHSKQRQADVNFSIVGERFFRFQISHALNQKVEIEEGFGIKAMRERLEDLGGTLKINQVEGTFRLIGTFPAEKGE